MKNKILYGSFLIILSMLLCGNVNAAKTTGACNDEKSMAVLQLNEVATEMIKLRFSSVFPSHGTTYYQMTLDGRKSMCVNEGLAARSGNKYKYVGPATDRNHIMSYGYYVNNGYGTNSIINWAISQSVAWYGIDTNKISKIVAADTKLKTIAARMEKVAQVLGTLNSYAGGSYYYWDNYTIPGGQRMINDLPGCEEKKPGVCPSGSMVKSGEIGSCYVSKGGNTYLFSNVAVNRQSDQTNIHRQYGKELKEVGKYCSLFCQEYGEATLPGATGEALNLGSYIIWPTSDSNYSAKFNKNAYPLKFKGKLKCKLGVQPDDEMPGDYDACHLDPIYGEGQYNDSYKVVRDLYPRSDFNGTTWENVRKKIGRTKAAGSVCTAYYDLGGYGCRPDEKCLTPAKKQLAEAMKKLAEAQRYANNYEPKLQDKYCEDQFGIEQYCGKENTSGYDSALDAVDRAEDVVNTWQQRVDAINKQIEVCTTYIENYENACNILQDMSYCGAYQIDSGIYDFSSNASMWYEDEEYKTGDVSGENSNSYVTIQGAVIRIPEGDKINDVQVLLKETPPLFEQQVKQIKANEYEVTADETYTLTTGYNYIDKDNLKYKTSKEGLSNYVDIGKEVIPTSYNNEVGIEKYELSLNNIVFGSSMSNFGLSENGSPSNYVCKQEFKKNSDLCVCPENTLNAGKPLSCMIKDSGETCLDAQTKYCEQTGIEFPEDCDLYCDAPMDYVPISSCVNAGYTADQCKAKICFEPIKCKNSNNVGGYMDITSCVQTKVMQGKTKQEAIDACDALICPIGKTIIYRTIKLENPFPGKNISKIASGFNNDVKGRFPGINWNSQSTVYSKIRNNRGVSGTTIYNTKKPLYTFVLNGVTIKNIRNYNDKQEEGYNDFTLECKKNNSSGCVSTFVHNASLSGIAGGTCENISLNNSFYTCDD